MDIQQREILALIGKYSTNEEKVKIIVALQNRITAEVVAELDLPVLLEVVKNFTSFTDIGYCQLFEQAIFVQYEKTPEDFSETLFLWDKIYSQKQISIDMSNFAFKQMLLQAKSAQDFIDLYDCTENLKYIDQAIEVVAEFGDVCVILAREVDFKPNQIQKLFAKFCCINLDKVELRDFVRIFQKAMQFNVSAINMQNLIKKVGQIKYSDFDSWFKFLKDLRVMDFPLLGELIVLQMNFLSDAMLLYSHMYNKKIGYLFPFTEIDKERIVDKITEELINRATQEVVGEKDLDSIISKEDCILDMLYYFLNKVYPQKNFEGLPWHLKKRLNYVMDRLIQIKEGYRLVFLTQFYQDVQSTKQTKRWVKTAVQVAETRQQLKEIMTCVSPNIDLFKLCLVELQKKELLESKLPLYLEFFGADDELEAMIFEILERDYSSLEDVAQIVVMPRVVEPYYNWAVAKLQDYIAQVK